MVLEKRNIMNLGYNQGEGRVSNLAGIPQKIVLNGFLKSGTDDDMAIEARIVYSFITRAENALLLHLVV